MNEEKLSSDQVPEKFAEWLLAMGCPPEKVPSVDKIAEMCRGQYYMVWRSLMEHVEPKQSARVKKLQVFRDDIERCEKNNVFLKLDTSVVVPEALSLWKQQVDLKQEVAESENRAIQARQSLNQLMDKISSKLSHRKLARGRLQDAQRRAWLLRQVGEDLRGKRDNLLETRAIADDLCLIEETAHTEGKLDQCLSQCRRAWRRPGGSLQAAANPAACSSIASTNSELDTDEHVISLVKCGGESLCVQLCERRAELAAALAAQRATRPHHDAAGVSPQSVLSSTAALHCSLALDAIKHKAHIKQTQKRLATALTELNNYLSGEECELLVMRCERGRAQARVAALREQLAGVTSRGGPFAAALPAPIDRDTRKQIAATDKAIEIKRDELKRLITSLAITERKIQNVRECLIMVFNGFHGDAGCQYDRFGGQLSLPQESIPSLRHYYADRRERRRSKMEFSLNLDVSDHCSFTDPTGNANPTFIDELKIYLAKFSLEKNRQLVLESGEKVWVSQTLQSSVDRLQGQWHTDDVTTALVCPSVSLARNLLGLILQVQGKEETEATMRELGGGQRKEVVIDITSTREQENKTADKIKKRLNENLLGLQKTRKTLHHGTENLRLWAENHTRNYISAKRTLDGKTYNEYEAYYLDSLNI